MCSAPASSRPRSLSRTRSRIVATASVADLHDLEAKVVKAMGFRGARYIQINVPCPLGWGAASHDTIRIARLAIETGLFPIFEAEGGYITQVRKIRRPTPVIEYLKLQRRFAHILRDGADDPRVKGSRRSPTATSGITGCWRLRRDDDWPQAPSPPALPLRESSAMKHPYAIALDVGTSKLNHTGSWRTQRPVYVDRLPPCNAACPAGEDIQGWLAHAEAGEYEAAWRALTANNPLPAIMGRVCYHPCETACNRAEIDQAVGINSVERFLGDVAIASGWTFEKPGEETGKRVLVVGAGPAGLSAAYHLRRLGHAVTIREAGPLAGGMMRFGIPKYRLPRDVLDAEVKRIADLGVEIVLNAKVDDIEKTVTEGGYDAAFLAVGAHIAKRAYIPAGGAAKILDAASLLRSMEGEEPPMLGRKVVIYGGGNTALDAARTARRLGASEAIIVYRRTREKMPAHDFELEEALRRGRVDEMALDHQVSRGRLDDRSKK